MELQSRGRDHKRKEILMHSGKNRKKNPIHKSLHQLQTEFRLDCR